MIKESEVNTLKIKLALETQSKIVANYKSKKKQGQKDELECDAVPQTYKNDEIVTLF